MIVLASGFGMGVSGMSRLLRDMGDLATPDAGLDNMRCVKSFPKVPLAADVQLQLVHGVAVGVYINYGCVVHRVEVTCYVISAMQELLSKDEVVEVQPWIAEATEHPSFENSLTPAITETHHLTEGC